MVNEFEFVLKTIRGETEIFLLKSCFHMIDVDKANNLCKTLKKKEK